MLKREAIRVLNASAQGKVLGGMIYNGQTDEMGDCTSGNPGPGSPTDVGCPSPTFLLCPPGSQFCPA